MKRNSLLTIGATCVLAVNTFAADVREGLVAYWPLNTLDLTSTTTPDLANEYDLFLGNIFDTTPLVAGKFDQAIEFDGDTSQRYLYFQAPTDAVHPLPISRHPAFSVLMWVKGNGTNQPADRRFFSEASVANGDNNPVWLLGTQLYGTNASVRIYIRNPATVLVDRQNINTVTDGAPALDGTWHHIACVYDQGALRYYVDGTLNYTNTYGQGPSIYDTTAIGAIVRAAVGSYFTGLVDDVALWSRALSAAEIQDVMANSIQTPIPTVAPQFSVNPKGANPLIGEIYTFTAGAYGTEPITYQWQKNGAPITGEIGRSLSLTNVTLADSADYQVVAANSLGSATSAVATLTVADWPAPNITNTIVSYWPLNTVVGTKTPDLVSGYDMTLDKMSEANVVPGKFGNAFSFTNATGTLLYRINNPGDDLPIYNKPNFSVSLWVKGGLQSDKRVFSEGSTGDSDPLFNIGTHNGGSDGTVDSYIRTDTGVTVINHAHSTGIAFDDTWHHIAYVQRESDGLMQASWYIDGVLDPAPLGPTRPLTLNTTTIGGILRSSAAAWFTGFIDEVAVWSRALSPQEISILQVVTITNPPSKLQPLSISSFKSDLPAVVNGGTTTLRWDVSKDATLVSLNQGIGDVTAKTSVGIGSTNVTLNAPSTFVLTISRGAESLSATTTVAMVDGVAPNWSLLDNFDRYSTGPIANAGYWLDTIGGSVVVESFDGNNVVKTVNDGSVAFLPLQNLTVNENDARTLFFRMIPIGSLEGTIQQVIGLTDKAQRSYGDSDDNVGPMVYPVLNINDFVGIGTNAWYVGARNNLGGVLELPPGPLQTNVIYNVWVDITNAPMGDPFYAMDMFSVYIQKEGDANRTLLFQDYTSDRDLTSDDVILGPVAPNLDKLILMGNNSTNSALFDDFYLSQTGYNSTVPRPYGFTGGSTEPLPPLSIVWSGTQLDIQWTTGVLQEATTLVGPGDWSDVAGASPPSYKVTPGNGARFYRARQ